MNCKILSILLLILLASCNNNEEETFNEVSFKTIYKGHMSYSNANPISKQYQVFEKRESWINFIGVIENLHPSTADALKNISFDFDTNNLGIVVGQFYSYCCSEIEILKIYTENNSTKIDFTETEPGMAAALSQAFVIVEISK